MVCQYVLVSSVIGVYENRRQSEALSKAKSQGCESRKNGDQTHGMTEKDIGGRIDVLLDQLLQLSSTCGVSTEKVNPASGLGLTWQPEPFNSYIPANVLLPLAHLDDRRAREACDRIVAAADECLDPCGLWRYFKDKETPFFIPYETDTSALLSHVGRVRGGHVVDEDLFRWQLGEDGHFNLWFLPSMEFAIRRPRTLVSLLANRWKARGYLPYRNGVIADYDREFCVTANVLCLVGNRPWASTAVERLITEMTATQPIGLTYYPSETVACYLYARCFMYGGVDRLGMGRSAMMGRLTDTADQTIVIPGSKWLAVIRATSMLMMDIKGTDVDCAVEQAMAVMDGEDFSPYPFYCSNRQTDFDHTSALHNAYFGSTALTIAHCIEMLCLIRMRLYGIPFGPVN